MNKSKESKTIIKKINFRINENINRSLVVSPNSIIKGYNFFDP